MKENKEPNPNALCPWSLQGWVDGGECVTDSLKGSHAQVSRQGSPHSRTVFWIQVKGNLSPMKYQEPWQEQWARSQEPQGQKETFQTCMERTLGKLWPMGQGCVLY